MFRGIGQLRLRAAVHRQLDPEAWDGPGLSPANRLLALAILLVTGVAILRTEPLVAAGRGPLFDAVELAFAAAFAAELALRTWSAGEVPRFGGLRGRMRFLATPGAVLDIVVIAASLLPAFAGGLLPFRLLRVAALVRLAKLGHLSRSVRNLAAAVFERRHELVLTVVLALALMVVGATAMWVVEGPVQPDKFGSIPRAMWWAAVTLLTIGYGDVYPVTVAGRILAVLVAIAGVGLIAMPAGILAAAFSDVLRRARREGTEGEGTDRPDEPLGGA